MPRPGRRRLSTEGGQWSTGASAHVVARTSYQVGDCHGVDSHPPAMLVIARARFFCPQYYLALSARPPGHSVRPLAGQHVRRQDGQEMGRHPPKYGVRRRLTHNFLPLGHRRGRDGCASRRRERGAERGAVKATKQQKGPRKPAPALEKGTPMACPTRPTAGGRVMGLCILYAPFGVADGQSAF